MKVEMFHINGTVFESVGYGSTFRFLNNDLRSGADMNEVYMRIPTKQRFVKVDKNPMFDSMTVGRAINLRTAEIICVPLDHVVKEVPYKVVRDIDGEVN